MDGDLLPGSLQWWHLLLTMAAIVLTFGMKAFSGAFREWAEKLDVFQHAINNRLTHMEHDLVSRMSSMEKKLDRHEERVHDLTIRVERRVTWIEAKIGAMPIAPEENYPRGKEK